MVRSLWCLAFAALLVACEPSTKGVNIASKQPMTYASFRAFDFLEPTTPATSTDTFLTVEDELPVDFGDLAAPVATDYQQALIGQWTAYISQAGETIVTSPVQNPTEGQLLTLVETGTTAAPSVTWVQEDNPKVTAGEAGVRFVLGASSASGEEVDLSGGAANVVLTSNGVLGQMTSWQQVEPTATSLVVDTGTPTSFPITPPAAGSLHTYAVVTVATDADGGTQLDALDITESTAGGNATVTQIAPSST